MLNNDSIRQVLKMAVYQAARRGATVIDADAEIAKLGRYYPSTATFDVNALRREIAEFARERGLAVKMGGR